MRKSILFIPMLMCLALSARAVATERTWVQAGQEKEALNLNKDNNAYSPRLAIYNGTPYVNWIEYDPDAETNSICVKCFDAEGNTWSSHGESWNCNIQCHSSDIAISSAGTVYVCWYDNVSGLSEINVRHYNKSEWVLDVGSLTNDPSQNAGSPAIAFYNDTPYVSWQESNGSKNQIYVKYLEGSLWVGGAKSLNVDELKSAESPAIAVYNGTPYVSWQESNGSKNQIYVKYLEGSLWVGGESLNVIESENAGSPAIAVYNGTPYVSWQENNGTVQQIYVKHYDNNKTEWVQDGGSLNVITSKDAYSPAIAVYDGTPYVSWQESDGTAEQIYVKHYDNNETKWVQDGGSLNIDSEKNAYSPAIAVYNDTPYVSWQEVESGTGTALQIYAAYYVVSTPTPVSTLISTPSPTPTEVAPVVTKTPAVVKLTPAIPAGPFIVHPNVLRTSTGQPVRITIRIDRTQRVLVKIFTRGGKLVKTLVDRVMNAGTFETVWDGIDRKGQVVPSGIYIVYTKTDDFEKKRKIVVVR